MLSPTNIGTTNLDHFFSSSAARLDRWRELNARAQTWAADAQGGKSRQGRAAVESALVELAALEDFFAYPGPRLMKALAERISSDDALGVGRMVRRMSGALLSGSYRYDGNEWETADDAAEAAPDRLSTTFGGGDNHRPYFETLFVSPAPAASRAKLAGELRRLRRTDDAMIYEPVLVGSVEDALLATIMNGKIEAVVIFDGIPVPSQHDVPLLRDLLASRHQLDTSSLAPREVGVTLARLIRRIRPELDLYLLTDRNVEKLAGDPAAAMFRRVFYEVEELMEVHLNVLEGVADRFSTPFFDNLKRYAARPIATFHALPIARGKSIMKSNWIRDMGEFYGQNLFLAESSATTGGLDSMLEPTGNIKVAQEKFARAVGADHVFFVTNGTSTSNKMVYQAVTAPGDIVIADRNCHKSHHYGMVLSGAQPLYVEAFPMTEYSMYGAVPLRTIKQAMLNLKAEGRLDRLKMITLTNCTFDGHVYNTRRVMEECLAIKPDVLFLWDEAWFGFARWSPFLRPRTGLGAAAALEEWRDTPAALEAWKAQAAELGEDLDPKDPRLLKRHLIPDPRKIRIRVYETDSVHKSMSALRQGSIVAVRDEDYQHHASAFREAVFIHASTSPNQQIIASLDLARRQMELEGYELVMRAFETAFAIRRAVAEHPIISKYFRVLGADAMVPAEYRASGFQDFLTPGTTWATALKSVQDGRVLPRPDAHDAGVRHGGLRRHLVQGPAGGQVQHPDEQDLAQQRALAEQHQQHAQRRRAADQGAARDLAGDRGAPRRGRRGRARGVRGTGEEPDGGRARPAELQPLPRRLPRGPGEHHARGRHARRLLCRLRRGRLRVPAADEPEDRRAAEERPGTGVGQLRDPVPAGLSDHGAGAGDRGRHDRVHAQARRQGDPRLQQRARPEADQAVGHPRRIRPRTWQIRRRPRRPRASPPARRGNRP